MDNDLHNLFIPTRRELTLSKVKELSQAWAGQPDLERIASLMPEGAELKIHRWKDRQCFTFNKHNLVTDFRRNLEDDFVIKSIVPFDPSCEAQFIVVPYVYYLEGKGELSRQKFQWTSTCLFSFDQAGSLKKISQHGELHPEDETLFSYQVYSQGELREKVESYTNAEVSDNLSIFHTEAVQFSFEILIFGSSKYMFTGQIKGFSEHAKLKELINYSKSQAFVKPILLDVFEDIDDPYYDSIIAIECRKGTINDENNPYRGKEMNSYSIFKFSFENGKLAKAMTFVCQIPDAIPSPYDNTTFSDLNIRPKSEFLP